MTIRSSTADLHSGSTPSKFDSLEQPLQQALEEWNKEYNPGKAGTALPSGHAGRASRLDQSSLPLSWHS